jgi:hypothetical protein
LAVGRLGTGRHSGDLSPLVGAPPEVCGAQLDENQVSGRAAERTL